MQPVAMPRFDPATLAGAVGGAAFARGFQYAQQQAVLDAEWDPAENMLHGMVRGSGGRRYATAAYFSAGGGRLLAFEQGVCSCPVGFNCKHAVALALTATAALAQAGSPAALTPGGSPAAPAPAGAPASQPRPAGSPAGSGPAGSGPAGWQRSLDSLLRSGTGSAARAGGKSLAIELSLAAGPGQPAAPGPAGVMGQHRLLARLVRPGRHGGWVAGGLAWGKLDSLRYAGDYPPGQVRLLGEMLALYRSRVSYSGYRGYSYDDDRWIELTAFESRQLWPLLDEAESLGVQLVHPGALGPVRRHADVELCLDVTRPARGGPLVITPVLRADGAAADLVAVAFIGSEGHGVACASRAGAEAGGDPGSMRFRLARLAVPVPPQLQRLALAGQALEIPAAGQARFGGEYYPRLRRAVTVISSDGSFTPPEISGPSLVLQAHYGPGHDLDLSWEWAYQAGDSQLRAPLTADPDDDGYRDPPAEQAILAGLELPPDGLGLLRPGPRVPGRPPALAPRARLDGVGTMRFTTELLPLLAGQPGVRTEITGEPASYREAGDSLQIAVSAGEVADETDWFDLGVSITVEGRQVPFRDVFGALSRGEQHLLLPDGAYFSLRKPELQALARLIEEAQALQDSPAGPLRISRFQAGLWDELASLGVISHQAAAWQEQVAGLLSAGTDGGPGQPEPPAALRARLRPYQQDGFGWLAFLWRHRLGGILADDMGLGKTLQCLALISHAKQAGAEMPPFLIIAPTSVVANWAAEAARFTPGLTVVPVTETVSRRGAGLGELVAGADAVVTSYTLLRLDFGAYAGLGWSGLLLDEAQHAKNHQSKIYQCARRLPAPVKVAITGTPLENNLMELWSLLSITAPGLFPSPARFRDYYARRIEKQGDAELLAQLQRRIRPLVRRRTKEQVAADLPAKQEQVVEVDLHPQHRRVYQAHLQRERQKVLGLISDLTANRFTVFRSLTLLRQLSLHAGLVDDAHRDLPCSKIDALLGQLRAVTGGGHRALVFSQFTGFLAHVRDRLDAEGVPYCYLDGRTRNRAAVIGRFKDGTAPVFLISLKAGGFGLNLTEADYCFLLDPWWNPATEAQAVDRTHRIGQTRNVMVYRLVAAGTIEEKVMALKARKAELFASVLDSGDAFGTALDADDIRGLLA